MVTDARGGVRTMPIEKILKVENAARFAKLTPQGGVPFRRLSWIKRACTAIVIAAVAAIGLGPVVVGAAPTSTCDPAYLSAKAQQHAQKAADYDAAAHREAIKQHPSAKKIERYKEQYLAHQKTAETYRAKAEQCEANGASCVANKNLGEIADGFISRCRKGSIRREFPSQLLDESLGNIKGGSSAAHKKAWKLLNDNRFKK